MPEETRLVPNKLLTVSKGPEDQEPDVPRQLPDDRPEGGLRGVAQALQGVHERRLRAARLRDVREAGQTRLFTKLMRFVVATISSFSISLHKASA